MLRQEGDSPFMVVAFVRAFVAKEYVALIMP